MRSLVTLLTVLLLAGAAWFLLAGDGGPMRSAAAPEVVPLEREPLHEPAILAETKAADSRQESPVVVSPKSTLEREALASGSVADPAPRARVVVRGRVVLLDNDERRYEQESGTVRILPADKQRGEFEVPLEAGRFEFESAAAASFRVTAVELQGTDCGFEEEIRDHAAREGLELEVLVRQRVPSSLIVRDKATSQDLQDLELWNREGWSFNDARHPGDEAEAKLVSMSLSSPIQLPTRDAKQAWWVRAPGYAWDRVDFDHRYGGERIVLLERAATLVVQLENYLPDRLPQIRLRRTDLVYDIGAGTIVRPSERGEARIEDLIPGTFEVSVMREADDENKRPLVSETVELVASQVSHVTVTLPGIDLDAGVGRVRVSGTLELPPGIEQGSVSLRWHWQGAVADSIEVEPIETFERVGGSRSFLAWHSDELLPGAWEVEVRPLGYVEPIVIGPVGASGITLRPPPLAEVHVQLLDGVTGEPVSGGTVNWYRADNQRIRYFGAGKSSGEPGMYSFSCVPGSIRIDAHGQGYGTSTKNLTVSAGRRELALELLGSVNVKLILKDGSTVITRDIAWWLGLEGKRTDGEGDMVSFSFDGSASMEGELSAPGHYRFTFAKIDGYLPIEPIEVYVERGSNEVEVALTRAQ